MTRQEMFNVSATHLLKQGEKALSSQFACRYRTSKGLKCAIGVLIPDEVYTPKWESRRVSVEILQACGCSAGDLEFARALQDVHDSTMVERWVEGLRELAAQYQLSTEHVPALAEAQ